MKIAQIASVLNQQMSRAERHPKELSSKQDFSNTYTGYTPAMFGILQNKFQIAFKGDDEELQRFKSMIESSDVRNRIRGLMKLSNSGRSEYAYLAVPSLGTSIESVIAQRALENLWTPELIPLLQLRLESKNPHERRKIVEIIGNKADLTLFETLIVPRLKDPDKDVRIMAIKVIAKRGPRNVAIILLTLKDTDKEVQQAINTARNKIRQKEKLFQV